MQSMPPAMPEAIAPFVAPSPVALVAAFARVPDPRRPHGRRFPLAAVLAFAVVALLANHLSVLAIAQWGKRQSRDVLVALGFPEGVAPHQTTIQRLFRSFDPLPLTVALTACFAPVPPPQGRRRGSVGVTSDGKARRGRLARADHPEYPIQMASAVLHALGIVAAQVPLDQSGEKAEVSAAPALIGALDRSGRVMSGDALHCDDAVCTAVTDAGGDYL